MKALVYQGPWEIVLADRADPQQEAGQTLLRVIATGVCGSDLHGFTGHTGRRVPDQVMGHETVARVEQTDPAGSTLSVGDIVVVNPAMSCGECPACRDGQEQRCRDLRVIGVVPEWDAAFAELMVVPTSNCIPLPPDTPEHLGALVEPLAVGWHAVQRARIRADETVVVIGGGPIGQAVALGARRAGASHIVVSEGLASRRDLVRSLGFEAVDPDELGDVTSSAAIGVGTIFDAVGSSASVSQALTLMNRGGRVVLVGMADPQLTLAAFEISVREREIIGTFCYSRADFASTVDWLASNVDVAQQLVDAIEPLASGPEVFEQLASYSRDASKILLSPNA